MTQDENQHISLHDFVSEKFERTRKVSKLKAFIIQLFCIIIIGAMLAGYVS